MASGIRSRLNNSGGSDGLEGFTWFSREGCGCSQLGWLRPGLFCARLCKQLVLPFQNEHKCTCAMPTARGQRKLNFAGCGLLNYILVVYLRSFCCFNTYSHCNIGRNTGSIYRAKRGCGGLWVGLPMLYLTASLQFELPIAPAMTCDGDTTFS